MNLALLRLVANRSDFVSANLRSEIPFTPVEESAEAKAVRDFLGMRDRSTDYFVLAPTLALASAPALIHHLSLSTVSPAALVNYTREPFFIPGATLEPDISGPPRCLRFADDWPVSTRVQLQYLDSLTARITCGNRSEDIQAMSSNGVVEVQWPSWTGIKGQLRCAWTDGSSLSFTLEPRNYPFAQVLKAIQRTPEWIPLLDRHGLLSAYGGATTDPVDRLAMIALALAKENESRNA